MTNTRDELYVGPVEVIISVAHRRRSSLEEKRAIVQEAESSEMAESFTRPLNGDYVHTNP